jgi:hypothetical protein
MQQSWLRAAKNVQLNAISDTKAINSSSDKILECLQHLQKRDYVTVSVNAILNPLYEVTKDKKQ